jgi:hypothetical protein
MAEVVLSSEELTVLGGPASINLELDFGPQGDRGSLTFYGFGKPSPTTLTVVPRVYDSYINIGTSDDEYLFVYQYISGAGGSPNWTKLFKLVPNIYNENETQIFNTSGLATVVLPIDKILPLNEISVQENFARYTAESFSIQCNVINPDPVAVGVTVSSLNINPIDGKMSLFININGIEYADQEWSPLVGSKMVHLIITVV